MHHYMMSQLIAADNNWHCFAMDLLCQHGMPGFIILGENPFAKELGLLPNVVSYIADHSFIFKERCVSTISCWAHNGTCILGFHSSFQDTKQLLDEVSVISKIVMVEVSVTNRDKGETDNTYRNFDNFGYQKFNNCFIIHCVFILRPTINCRTKQHLYLKKSSETI